MCGNGHNLRKLISVFIILILAYVVHFCFCGFLAKAIISMPVGYLKITLNPYLFLSVIWWFVALGFVVYYQFQ